VSEPKKYLAFLAYLLPVVGWLYVLLFQREDEFAMYHAKQSLALTIAAVLTPVAWAVAAWVIAWVPLVGPALGAFLFALVVLAYIALAATWVTGMVDALRAKIRPLPFVGVWAERLSIDA
jgi:uncharacterized membrane protein